MSFIITVDVNRLPRGIALPTTPTADDIFPIICGGGGVSQQKFGESDPEDAREGGRRGRQISGLEKWRQQTGAAAAWHHMSPLPPCLAASSFAFPIFQNARTRKRMPSLEMPPSLSHSLLNFTPGRNVLATRSSIDPGPPSRDRDMTICDVKKEATL